MIKRQTNSQRRKLRTRFKVASTGAEYRLSVNRSSKFIYAQIVELVSGKTLFGVKSKDPAEAGKSVAEKAKKMKISRVVFDRGPYKYHGRVKLLADQAREAGLVF